MREPHPLIVGDEHPRRRRPSIIEIGEEMSIPATQEYEREEAYEVGLLVVEEEMPGRLIKEPEVAVALPEAVVQVPILRARPHAPLGDPEQAARARREEL